MSEVDPIDRLTFYLEKIAKSQERLANDSHFIRESLEKQAEFAESNYDQFEILLSRMQGIENILDDIEAKTLDTNKAITQRKYSSFYCTFDVDGTPRVWWPHYYEEPLDSGSYIKLITKEMLTAPIEERVAAGENRAALDAYYHGYADDHDWAITTYSWQQIGEVNSSYDQIMRDGEDVPTPGIREAHKRIVDMILELQVLKENSRKFGRLER